MKYDMYFKLTLHHTKAKQDFQRETLHKVNVP